MARLPAYSPELNPDEQVWNHAKQRLAKLTILDKDSMKKALFGILRSIQRSKSLVKSYFRKKEAKHILEAINRNYCDYLCNH